MSHKIQEYKMIVTHSGEDLESKINELLKKGYELHGIPGMQTKGADLVFCQAMVLKGEF